MAQMAGRLFSRLRFVAPISAFGRPVAPIVMAAAIPILLFAGWMSFRTANDERSAARAAAREVVDRAVERVAAELSAHMQVAATLALSAALDEPDLAVFYREAQRLRETRPLWYTVELDDPSGRQVMNLLRPLGSDLGATADRESFERAVKAQRPVAGGIGPVGPVSQRRLVTLRAPVMRGGMLQSVLTVALAPDAISAILRGAGVPAGWVGAVVDGRGNVIARTLAEEATLGEPASPDLRLEIGRATSGSYPGRTLEGVDCEVNFRILSEDMGRWSVHLGVPIEELNRPIARSLLTVGAGMVASLALAAGLASLVSRELSRLRAVEVGLADATLRESEQRGALAIEAAELGTWRWDLSTDRVSGSARCRTMLIGERLPGAGLEWSADEFLGSLEIDDREAVRSAARQSRDTGESFQTIVAMLGANGSQRWLRVRGRALGNNDGVVMGVVADITVEKLAEQNRLHLLRRLAGAQEEVQGRIARELHDQVGQTVTGLSLGLKGLERTILGGEGTAGPGAELTRSSDVISTISWLQGLARDIGRDIHRAAADLRPTALDDLGLIGALSALAADWSRRYGIAAEVQFVGAQAGRFSTEVETAAYRVVQEALTNVLKHANARSVSILLERRSHELRVWIEDDGQGFDPDGGAAPNGGRARLGLSGIRERLHLLGGALQVEAGLGRGTTLFATIPLDRPLAIGR